MVSYIHVALELFENRKEYRVSLKRKCLKLLTFDRVEDFLTSILNSLKSLNSSHKKKKNIKFVDGRVEQLALAA